MLVRFAVVLAGALAALPVNATEMKADEARRFVVGKLFSFHCFEGSSGAGRIHADGSVAGVVRFKGTGPMRYIALPAGTLRVRGENVCASVRGMPLEPCFDLVRTDAHSFRGAVSGLNFAYCSFTRRAARAEVVRTSAPLPIGSAATTSKGE